MERVSIPYGGPVLVSHLAAYGLAFALDAAGIDAFVGHDPDSQTFEPFVLFDGSREQAREAVRASAARAEHIVEHNIDPAAQGVAQRATVWARVSVDGERLRSIAALRQQLLLEVDATGDPVPLGLLGGLGALASWGGDHLKSSQGATALDGVLGNNTSDFVRGLLRPTRQAVADAPADRDLLSADGDDLPTDRTSWAPPGTRVDYVHQWLAALGIALFPVAHRLREASATPACWSTRPRGRRDRVTLPLLDAPASVPRLRALVNLAALAGPLSPDGDRQRAIGVLRSHGIKEVVEFERRDKSGGGTSVAFFFRRGRRIALR
jgi:hypothetical protein